MKTEFKRLLLRILLGAGILSLASCLTTAPVSTAGGGPDPEKEKIRLDEEKKHAAEMKKLEAEKAKLAELEDLRKHPGGTLRVFCEAGYVAQFFATWDERQSDGSFLRKTWSSPRLPVGRRSSVTIPPRSRNVRLTAKGDVVGEIFSVTPDFQKEYKVYGTIFKSRWTAQ